MCGGESEGSRAARRDGISGCIICIGDERTTGWATCTVGELKDWVAAKSDSIFSRANYPSVGGKLAAEIRKRRNAVTGQHKRTRSAGVTRRHVHA